MAIHSLQTFPFCQNENSLKALKAYFEMHALKFFHVVCSMATPSIRRISFPFFSQLLAEFLFSHFFRDCCLIRFQYLNTKMMLKNSWVGGHFTPFNSMDSRKMDLKRVSWMLGKDRREVTVTLEVIYSCALVYYTLYYESDVWKINN